MTRTKQPRSARQTRATHPGRTVRTTNRASARPKPRTHAHSMRSPLRGRLVVAAVAVAALLVVAFALRTCAATGAGSALTAAFTSHTAYQWENLATDERGRLAYVENGTTTSRTGIDVSEHQGYIDWSAVAADGIDFAIVRLGNRGATSGLLNYDDYGAYNLEGAAAAGLDVGAYFFSQAVTEQEAVEEAEFVLSQLGGMTLSFPVVYDHEPVFGVEGRADNLSVEQMTANARAFCTRIEQAGYAAMIYGNATDLARYNLAGLASYGVWYAEYGVASPSTSSGFALWQYSNEGSVAGIDTVVDLNILLPRAN